MGRLLCFFVTVRLHCYIPRSENDQGGRGSPECCTGLSKTEPIYVGHLVEQSKTSIAGCPPRGSPHQGWPIHIDKLPTHAGPNVFVDARPLSVLTVSIDITCLYFDEMKGCRHTPVGWS